MKRSGPPRRRTRLRARSQRTVEQQPTRDQVCEQVAAEYRHRCALARFGWCAGPGGMPWRQGGPLDFHEVIRRSQWPGAHLDPRLVIPLCRAHHELDGTLSIAEQHGIRAPRWAVDQYGLDRVLAELARLREHGPGIPFWNQLGGDL